MQGALSSYDSTLGNEVKSAHFVWSYIYVGSQKQEISKGFWKGGEGSARWLFLSEPTDPNWSGVDSRTMFITLMLPK